MTRQTKNFIYKKQKQVSLVAAILVLSLLISYVYFVNMTISTIAQHNDLKDMISDIQSDSTEIEERYLSLQDGVSIDMAYTRGLIDATDTKFVSRDIRVSLYE
jgi:hypothetical protein